MRPAPPTGNHAIDWTLPTLLGNVTTVLPLLACAMTWLAIGPGADHRRRAVALRWALLSAAALALVAASKFGFYAWGWQVAAWDLTCFSGHTVAGFLAWPPLLLLVAPRRWPPLRVLAFASGLAIALVIAVSRVAVGAHPPSEVVAGGLLGAAVAAGAAALLWRQSPGPGGRAALALLLCALLVYGPALQRRVPSEHWLAWLASRLTGHPAWTHPPR